MSRAAADTKDQAARKAAELKSEGQRQAQPAIDEASRLKGEANKKAEASPGTDENVSVDEQLQRFIYK